MTGKTFDEVIMLQQKQYYAKTLTKDIIPTLVSNHNWPKASGKITRFVEVD
jgi:hypothetical protein